MKAIEKVKWRNPDALIKEENILIAAGLRDCLRLRPEQRVHFLNTFLDVPAKPGKTDLVVLSKVARDKTWPYDDSPSILPGSDNERLFYRIIEERTGLMASDIAAIYGTGTKEHRDHIDRWMKRIEWNEENLFVLAGFLALCTQGDAKAAMRLSMKWLGIESHNKYGYPHSMVGLLRKYYPRFNELIEKEWDADMRERFERLLRSKESTKDRTIQTLAQEYELHARIDWRLPKHQLLWAGLTRYASLTWRQAAIFLEEWFQRSLRAENGDFMAPHAGLRAEGKKMDDIAPLGNATIQKEFEALLAEKGWTIQKVTDYIKDTRSVRRKRSR